jgi:hypothetical protein
MALSTFKVLYQGQLGAAVATLATVGTGKTWIIKHITAVNNDTVARTFGLYVGGTTASKVITPPNVSIPNGGAWEWCPCDICLESAQTLAGGASAATQVTVTVFGDEIG